MPALCFKITCLARLEVDIVIGAPFNRLRRQDSLVTTQANRQETALPRTSRVWPRWPEP